MAIQPIDLQTLFSQMDKVGKSQSEQTEGVHIQQSLQGALTQRKVEERSHSVNETPDSGNGLERIKDKPRKRGGGNARGKSASDEQKSGEAEEDRSEIVTDPNLGKNIDLSG